MKLPKTIIQIEDNSRYLPIAAGESPSTTEKSCELAFDGV